MKYTFRKSFSFHRRKEIHDDEHIHPQIDTNGCSNSNLNLVKPVKSKSFLQRRRRHSSTSPPPPSDQTKSKVFEPRYDIHSNHDDEDDDDQPFSSSTNTRRHPFNRITNQIRKSFRNTLSRQRSRLESTTSNKRLIVEKNNENQIFYPIASTGLTSPLTKPTETIPTKRRKAPLAPTHMNQSISLPIDIKNIEHEQTTKQNTNRTFRRRFSFFQKKRPSEDTNPENSNSKSTLSQRFNSLRRSFHIGNKNSSTKGKRQLLSDE